MLPTTLFTLLSLPLLALAAPHGSSSRSTRPHAKLAAAAQNGKRVYGLPVQMDTTIPSPSTPALEARIVIPDHVTEDDLYRREVLLKRESGIESGGRMMRKRASCKITTTSSSSSAQAASSTKVVASSSAKVASSSARPSSTSSSSSASTSASSSSASYTSGWTSASTNGQSLAVSSLQHVSLAEAVKATKGDTPSFSDAPDGSYALAATYKANDVGADAGWSYYADGPVDISGAQEVELTYSVYFADGFTWVKGGKLPGMYGGVGSETGCSGGDQSTRDICFSARLMWRESGAGEIYTYLPISTVNTAACTASGSDSVCDNQTYGLSFGRGNFNFKTGSWVTVKERTRLNDVGKSNGYIYLTVDGVVAIKAENLSIRTRSDSKFEGMMMSSFFGGSTSAYAPSSTQNAWFKDFTLGVIA